MLPILWVRAALSHRRLKAGLSSLAELADSAEQLNPAGRYLPNRFDVLAPLKMDARTAGGTEESTLLSSTETLSGAETVRIADLGPHLS